MGNSAHKITLTLEVVERLGLEDTSGTTLIHTIASLFSFHEDLFAPGRVSGVKPLPKALCRAFITYHPKLSTPCRDKPKDEEEKIQKKNINDNTLSTTVEQL